MPGTIQVTVLEFKGVSSSSKPSAKSLKVSMGKRHYQTWDKGEFSFTITKLGEDLVVALLDAGGNEIAHADIRTMQIVEKGYWDDVFSIDGGGHVHMKLQFILSEEERNRIRVMRESVMKKKLETNPNINLRLSETFSSTRDSVETSTKNEENFSDSHKGFVEIDVVRPKVNDSQAGSFLTSATSSAALLSSYRKEGVNILQSEIIPDSTDGSSQGAPYSSGKNGAKIESPQVHETKPDERSENQPIASSKLSGSAFSDKNGSFSPKPEDDIAQKSRNQGPQEKTPSNVKKMINAFENSQLQEVKSLEKAPSVPSQLNRFRKDVLFEDGRSEAIVHPVDKSLKKAPSVPSQLNKFRKEQLSEDWESKVVVMHPADTSSTKLNDHFAEDLQQTSTIVSKTEPSEAPKELASTVTPILSREQTVKELEKSPDDLTRQSTSETATTSGRLPEEQYQETQRYELSPKTVNSFESSVAEGSGSGRGTGLKNSTMVDFQVDSYPKPKSPEYYKEECYFAQSSGMWIFPDNTTRLCITTAGNQVMETVGHHHNEAEPRQVNKVSSEPEVREKNLMHGAGYKAGKNQKKIAYQTESGCGSSPDDSSNGLVRQVIKIAIILGFGVLVLLTRQKEPRKKHREENHSFSTPDYVTLKPWPQQQ